MDTTDPESPTSANEAICVKVQGQQFRQLARQLTCLALNCQFTGGGEDCTGETAGGQDLGALFAVCDRLRDGSGRARHRGRRLHRAGRLHQQRRYSGRDRPGEWTCAGGECSIDGELCGFDEGDCAANACVGGLLHARWRRRAPSPPIARQQDCELFEAQNCHQRDLCPEDGEFCFEPPGSASPGDCKASNKTSAPTRIWIAPRRTDATEGKPKDIR